LSTNGTETGTRLIQLRNPWIKSGEEYSGLWHNDDAKWTDEWKSQAGNNSTKKDGVFLMPFENFVLQFNDYTVAVYEEDFVTT